MAFCCCEVTAICKGRRRDSRIRRRPRPANFSSSLPSPPKELLTSGEVRLLQDQGRSFLPVSCTGRKRTTMTTNPLVHEPRLTLLNSNVWVGTIQIQIDIRKKMPIDLDLNKTKLMFTQHH